jgi:hypothetical protein
MTRILSYALRTRSFAPLRMTAAGSRSAHTRNAPSLLVFYVHVLGVDDAFIFLLAAAVRARLRT